jgi:hypothetical protein
VKKPFNGDRAKDGKILQMYHHGYTYDQIAKELHVAPNHIASVIKAERTRVDKEKRNKQNASALQLFSHGKSPLDVCIKLAISADEAFSMHNDYLELTGRYNLVEMHEELGKYLTNLINLYKTMKNSGIPREDIIKLSKDYFTIPHARNDLKNLLDEVRRQKDKRDQYISDWQKLNNHNMDLKRENRYLKDENRDLEKKNRDLEIKNRDLRRENSKLERIACRKVSLDITMKDPKSAAPRLPGYTDPNSSNKTYTSGDQGLRYLSFDPPSILPMKLKHNMSKSEIKPSGLLKGPTPSKPTSPDTTISSSTHDLFKKEPDDTPDT